MDRNKRRKFGQNFLNNRAIAVEILSDIPLQTEDEILEVGPGDGAITTLLLEQAAAVTSVEIDRECAANLQKRWQNEERFTLINQDFLEFDLQGFLSSRTRPLWMVGNLPYNVSTGIITSSLPHLQQMQGMMFMVQLEVAERLCAEPGNKAFGSLSVFLQSWGQAHILRKVGPEHFHPRPNVDSATILISPRLDAPGCTPEFEKFVQLAFSQKRKKVINSLQSAFSKENLRAALAQLELSENTRAEEISTEKFHLFYDIMRGADK